tara:strand:+ start:11449 stop:12375 length:927 start_codon:yes stop_codon:yes gene_type:complete
MDDNIEADYLDVDKPIPGQNYVCLSFVSPDKILNQKGTYLHYNHVKHVINRYQTIWNNAVKTIISESDEGMVEVSKLMDMRKSLETLYAEDDVDFEKYKSNLEDYKFSNEVKVNEEFDKMNNYQTSVRGVKIRGVYDTRQEAEIRAKVLQRSDTSHNIFLGQVGYWLPWDPENVEDQEYLNDDLNKLVKEQKNNMAKKDMFYQEQKTERIKEAKTTADRLREKLANKKKREEEERKMLEDSNTETKQESNNSEVESNQLTKDLDKNKLSDEIKFDVGDSKSQEVSVEDTIDNLQTTDPWLQRKMDGNQ